MPTTKQELNNNIQAYRSNNDVKGLIQYLQTVDVDSDTKIKINSYISELKDYDSFISNVEKDSEQKDILLFSKGFNSGELPQNNRFTNRFNRHYNKLGNANGYNANALSIQMSQDDYYDFIKSNNLNDEFFNNYNITVKDNSSDVELYFDKSNPNGMQLLNKVYNTLGKFKTITSGTDFSTIPSYVINGYVNNDKISSIGSNDHDYVRTMQIVNHSNKRYDALINKPLEKEILSTTNLYDENISCALDYEIQQAFANKQISTSEYNILLKQLEIRNNRTLANLDLNTEDWYLMNTSKNDTGLHKPGKKDNAYDYNDAIKRAISRGDNLTLTPCMAGGELGTMITVIGKDKTKQNNDDNDLIYQTFSVFVPNLFKDNAENKLKQDTQVRASLNLEKARIYNYDYHFDDNSYISDLDNYGGIFHDSSNPNNPGEYYSISELKDIANEKLALQDITNNAKVLYNKELKDNNQQNNPKNYSVNLETMSPTDAYIFNNIQALVMEQYKKNPNKFTSQDYNNKVKQLYDKILSNINFEGSPMLNLINQ